VANEPSATKNGLANSRWQGTADAPTRRALYAVALVTLALMLWGMHGSASILHSICKDYWGPGSDPVARPSLIAGIAWDDELISFVFGALTCVALPAAVLRFWIREPLRAYGLGPPPRDRMKFAAIAALVTVAVFIIPFVLGARSPEMYAVYPIFRGPLQGGALVAYEFAYLLFFIALDGILRGVLLFGIALPVTDEDVLPWLAIAVETLVQAVWHFGKPPMEAWTAPIWGVAGGYVAYRSRSVWPVFLAHWVLNVAIDLVCLHAR
jgi:membrane protease YdiL (CAAX protease family)